MFYNQAALQHRDDPGKSHSCPGYGRGDAEKGQNMAMMRIGLYEEEKEVGGRKTRSGECSLWALKLLAQTSWCWVH